MSTSHTGVADIAASLRAEMVRELREMDAVTSESVAAPSPPYPDTCSPRESRWKRPTRQTVP
jgi:hypothetical protein